MCTYIYIYIHFYIYIYIYTYVGGGDAAPQGPASSRARGARGPHCLLVTSCLLVTKPNQAPPGLVVIHNNRTNRMALPAMNHSSF